MRTLRLYILIAGVFEGYEDCKSAILTTLLNELREHRDLKNLIGDEIKEL